MPNPTISGPQQLPVIQVQSGRLIPLQLQFANSGVTIDLTTVVQGKLFGALSTCFIDNSQNANTLLVSVSGSNQTFEAPPYSNGMYPVAVTGIPTLTLSTVGTSSVNVQLYDYAVPPFVWINPPNASNSISIPDGDDITQGSLADVAVVNPASNGSVIALLKGILSTLLGGNVKVGGATAAGVALAGNGIVSSLVDGSGLVRNSRSDANGYAICTDIMPGTPISNSANTTTAAAMTATLTGAAGATTYLSGFAITGAGATAASVIAVTLTNVVNGTKTYYLPIPAGVTTSINPLIVEFIKPIPASGSNTAIIVNVPSFGSGNTNAAVTAHGFRL